MTASPYNSSPAEFWLRIQRKLELGKPLDEFEEAERDRRRILRRLTPGESLPTHVMKILMKETDGPTSKHGARQIRGGEDPSGREAPSRMSSSLLDSQ